MPKSGKVAQWCACGSDRRPHIAISFAARSLHVNPRVQAAAQTIYVCEICVKQFQSAIDRQSYFFRAINPRIRDRFLGSMAGSLLAVWDEIPTQVSEGTFDCQQSEVGSDA